MDADVFLCAFMDLCVYESVFLCGKVLWLDALCFATAAEKIHPDGFSVFRKD